MGACRALAPTVVDARQSRPALTQEVRNDVLATAFAKQVMPQCPI